ncbi:hypothetical protein QK292_00745 [Arthrobacter sp. AL08]|nr:MULTISPECIES: hypothetical protein [Micrococcaceae]MDI3240092.1 hypothetical protein [Arthrobacter sp. AL05]MDI3276102.1 hypothetical protein [Arthrobacter sp. AL08]MDJ0353892.1 hypothetical protein [Pseudarthrobacter sp. PH31-O2]WGZ78899.1 hypothetical protein QI450_13670 [Arthrobacter sp. EM1]
MSMPVAFPAAGIFFGLSRQLATPDARWRRRRKETRATYGFA